MHDPCTVAFEIKMPFFGWHLLTIWHHDPETDGSDDSCGWFMRARHGDKNTLRKIEKAFEFNWDADYGGWFNKDGTPRLSVIGIVNDMFSTAAFHHFGSRMKSSKFMRDNLHDIIHFAENNVDSLHSGITKRFGDERRDDRIRSMASCVYSFIIRRCRPAWKHPRWHFWHWRIQVHPWHQLKRRYWDKCCKCGKRGFPSNVAAIGDWDGDRIWHSSCDDTK